MGCAVACTDERDMHSSDPDTKIMVPLWPQDYILYLHLPV